jgi:tRNA nucleotidyltransferase/poly(A) polymerase
MTVKMFEVGGCVRDELLGVPSKDIDFSVVAENFGQMHAAITEAGLKIVLSTPEFATIRAVGEFRGHKGGLDFVWARVDGPSSDGRHPDWTAPGSLHDDLARRDFTVNAMAKDENGVIIDPFMGQEDLQARVLRFVGDPADRLAEDSLRALRAIRFAITKGFAWHPETEDALHAMDPATLASVSVERRREEMHKAFQHDTLTTLRVLSDMGHDFQKAVFADGLWLMPTLKG